MKITLLTVILFVSCTFAQEKKGTVSFSKDVMPVFTKRCLSCHNTEDEGPSMLFLDNYKQLMRGDSKHGPTVIPKKGEQSDLIKKLRGTTEYGRQMPRGKKPLDEETIEMISRWIDQGAKDN
jgi:hypothetical protein